MILKHFLIFAATALLDFLWAIYIKSVSSSNATKAALATVLIYGIGGLVTVSYVGNISLLVSATAGATVATYLTTRYWP